MPSCAEAYSSREYIRATTLEAGIGTDLDINAWRVNPELSVRFTHSRRAGIEEEGGVYNDFALRVNAQGSQQARVLAQRRVNREFTVAKWRFTPQITFGVQQSLTATPTSEARLTYSHQVIEQKAAVGNATLMRLGLGVSWQQQSWTIGGGVNMTGSLSKPGAANTRGFDAYLKATCQW